MACKRHLVVLLLNSPLIDEFEQRGDRAPHQLLLGVEVGDIPHDKIIAVERDGIPPLNEASDVVVTTDQCR